MLKRLKKTFVILLVLALVLPLFDFVQGLWTVEASSSWHVLNVSTNNPNVYESDMPGIENQLKFSDIAHMVPVGNPEFIIINNIDPNLKTHWVDGKNKRAYLNVELFLDQGIIVYGDYTLFNTLLRNEYSRFVKFFATDNNQEKMPSTYFREWHKIANTQNVYQTNNWKISDLRNIWLNPTAYPGFQTMQVEYRFIGYTLNYESYANPWFPQDSKDNWENNRWIYHHWTETAGFGQPHSYTQLAIIGSPFIPGAEEIPRQKLNEQIGDSITRGVKVDTSNKTIANQQTESYNFINALDSPSLYTSPRKRTYHFENSGNRFYQTLSLGNILNKVMP